MTMVIDFVRPPTPTSDSHSEPVTILVVDDSPVDGRLAGRTLERQRPWRVVYAANGLEALAVLEKEDVSAILTDLLMPEMDGLDLVQTVRSRTAFIPVVLMTGYGSEDSAVQALQRGAASYVPKKSIPRDLVPTLDRVLSAARTRRDQDRLRSQLTQTEALFVLDNNPGVVPAFLTYLQEQLAYLGQRDQSAILRLGIAVEEAILNGIYHGNLELGQVEPASLPAIVEERRLQPPYCDRQLEVEIRLSRQLAQIVVRDDGPGFDPSTLPDPTDPVNQGPNTGRGMLLIRNFMDQVRFNERGNEITLLKRLEV